MTNDDYDRQGFCGTLLMYSDKLKPWGGHESEEAMHAVQGTSPSKARQSAEELCGQAVGESVNFLEFLR